jgi:hypothetical protein
MWASGIDSEPISKLFYSYLLYDWLRQCTNVGFWYIPPRLRGKVSRHSLLTNHFTTSVIISTNLKSGLERLALEVGNFLNFEGFVCLKFSICS